MITKADLIYFWFNCGSTPDSIAMEKRLSEESFADDVPGEAANAMVAWANAKPGEESARFAYDAKKSLGLIR